LDLFNTPPSLATTPKVVETPTVSPEIRPEPPVSSTKTTKFQSQKKSIPQSESIAIYDQVVQHLATNEIPPFTPFHLKQATPSALKWCMDATVPNSDGTKFKPGQLVLFHEVQRGGQNTTSPAISYHEWEVLYSRSPKADQLPKGMGMKPSKPRTARGSRHRTTKEKDAS
jgi:hypothetical protein